MQTDATPRRWKGLAIQLAILGLAFAAGMYFGAHPGTPPTTESTKGGVGTKITRHSGPPTAAELKNIRTSLLRALRLPGKLNSQRALLNLIDGLDPETTKALLADISANPGAPERELLPNLIHHWAESDPEASLAWLVTLPDPSLKETLALSIFDAYSLRDPVTALQAYGKLHVSFNTTYLQSTILRNFAQQDPRAALAAIASLPGNGTNDAFGPLVVFQQWAQQDPATAALEIFKQPEGFGRRMSVSNVASAWAQQDPAAAQAWVDSLAEGPEKNSALQGLMLTVMETDSATAVALFDRQPNSDDYFFNRLTDNWALQDTTALLDYADKNLTGTKYTVAAKSALREMSQDDPAGAAVYLAKLNDANVTNDAIPALASAWAQKDIKAAMDWAQSLPADNIAVRNSALSKVLNGLSTTDPAAAAAFVQTLSADPSFGNLAMQTVNGLAAVDPAAAYKWAQGLPAGDAQNGALVTAVSQIAKSDPQSAWVAAQQLPNSNRDQAMGKVISAWADSDPTQATAALQNLPPGDEANSATTAIAKSWLAQDAAAATPWITSLPPGEARDGAVVQLISTAGKTDPATALTYAVSLGNQTTRNTQVVNLAKRWAAANPAAAAIAIQNAMGNLTGLTRAQQTTLQGVINKTPNP